MIIFYNSFTALVSCLAIIIFTAPMVVVVARSSVARRPPLLIVVNQPPSRARPQPPPPTSHPLADRLQSWIAFARSLYYSNLFSGSSFSCFTNYGWSGLWRWLLLLVVVGSGVSAAGCLSRLHHPPNDRQPTMAIELNYYTWIWWSRDRRTHIQPK